MLIESNEKYVPELIELWKKVFGDEEEYIRLFFEKAYYDSEFFGKICDGKIVSGFYLLKCSIRYEGKVYDGRYLYAAATLPEYRSVGIMSELIKEAMAYCKDKGLDFISLVPADDGLYDYYGRFGFYETMYKYRLDINKETATMRSFREISDMSEVYKIRSSFKGNMLLYNETASDYALSCLRFYGSRAFSLSEKAYYIESEELFCSDEDFSYITHSLINNLCSESAVYSNCCLNNAVKVRNGMIYCFDDKLKIKDVYMNIALD